MTTKKPTEANSKENTMENIYEGDLTAQPGQVYPYTKISGSLDARGADTGDLSRVKFNDTENTALGIKHHALRNERCDLLAERDSLAAKLAEKEKDRQYHMAAINRLQSATYAPGDSGTSEEVVERAMSRIAELACIKPIYEALQSRLSAAEAKLEEWKRACDLHWGRMNGAEKRAAIAEQRLSALGSAAWELIDESERLFYAALEDGRKLVIGKSIERMKAALSASPPEKEPKHCASKTDHLLGQGTCDECKPAPAKTEEKP